MSLTPSILRIEEKRLGMIPDSTCRFLSNSFFFFFSMIPLIQAVCRVLKYRKSYLNIKRRNLKVRNPFLGPQVLFTCYDMPWSNSFKVPKATNFWSHQISIPESTVPILGAPTPTNGRKFGFLRSTNLVTTCCFQASKILLL